MQTEYAGVVLDWADVTDVGRVRSLNEDSLLAAPPVFAVADGMGGHDAGEVASALVINRLASLQGHVPPDVDMIAAEFQEINDLLKSATVDGRNVDMGTTTVALIMASHNGVLGWLIVNVGDSRAYCAADGECHQVTSDHSYVQELVDAGQITAIEARRHPDRNVVTQALGVVDVVRPDFWIRPFRAGERFLLCSDGLSGEVEDAEIARALLSDETAASVATTLTEKALAAGGRDNVTIVVVDVVGTPADVGESTETKPKKARKQRAVDDGAVANEDTIQGERKINPAVLLAQLTINSVPFEPVRLDSETTFRKGELSAELIAQAPISREELAEMAKDDDVEPKSVGPMITAPPPSDPSSSSSRTRGDSDHGR